MKWYYALNEPRDIQYLRPMVSHMLISYANIIKGKMHVKHLDKLKRQDGVSLMLDSGAFTNFKAPGTVVLKDYLKFLSDHKGLFDEYVVLDDLRNRGVTLRNYETMKGKGFNPILVDHMWYKFTNKLDPVYRSGDKICWAGLLTGASPNNPLAIAPSGSKVNDKLPYDKLRQLYRQIIRDRLAQRAELAYLVPKTKIHLLGVAANRLRYYLRYWDIIDSVDPASYAVGPRAFGRVMWVTKDPDGWPRMHGGPWRGMSQEVRGRFNRRKLDPSGWEGRLKFCIRESLDFQKAFDARYQQAKAKKEDLTQLAKADEPYEVQTETKMAIDEINPRSLRPIDDQELLSLHHRMHQLHGANFAGNDKLSVGELNREALLNAYVFIIDEMTLRGMNVSHDNDLWRESEDMRNAKRAAAVIRPSADGAELPEILMDDVLKHFESFKIRMPFLYMVGGLPNRGKTNNDIDLLVKGPISDELKHVLHFRLGRMLPPDLSKRLSLMDDHLGGPFTNHIELADLVVQFRPKYEIKQMAVAKQDDPLMDWPKKEGKLESVVQYHFRGKSLHMDLRMKIDGYLVGWTMANQREGRVPDVNTVEQARMIADEFSPDGSRYTKPFIAPARLACYPKSRQPLAWLDMDNKVFEPGTVGGTREEAGVMVVADRPKVEWGIQKPYFHEQFFTNGKALNGVMYFRQLSGAKEAAENEQDDEGHPASDRFFWTCMVSKSALPSVLKPHAVQRGTMPPQGRSAIPSTLEEATPKQFRYWEMNGREAQEARDALVKEKFFTEENVKIVNGEFRRVIQKMYLYVPPKDVTKKLSPADQADLERENALIAENKKKPEATKPHKFQAAKWTHPNGHPRCIICGDEERVGGWCNKRVGKAERKFVLSWQWWKGPASVRNAPSRQIWHLAIDDTKGLLDYRLQHDPLSGEEAITAHLVRVKGKALLTLDGAVEPGEMYDGDVLNDTKATPSQVAIIDSGKVEVEEMDAGRLHLRFGGKKLTGSYTLEAEEKDSPIWVLAINKEVTTSKADDDPWLAGDVTLIDVEYPTEEEVDKAVPVEDGVQIWDPEKKDPDTDRTELRPLAIFKPMKPTKLLDDANVAMEEFGKPEYLEQGVGVEGKWNGFRFVVEKKGDRLLSFTDDEKRDLLPLLPYVTAELKKIPGDWIIDTEFMAINEAGDFMPRRDLAMFRGKEKQDDSNVRLMVHDILYYQGHNLLAESFVARRKVLEDNFFGGAKGKRQPLVLSEVKMVGDVDEMRSAMSWARKLPGSEGVMLKLASSTYSLGGQTSSWGKLKEVQEIRAIVYDRHPVKGTSGVYNFHCAIGPIPESEKDKWKEVVEINGKLYTPIGKTFSAKLDAKPGDVLRVESTELLVDKTPGRQQFIHWFTPTVIDKTNERPMTTEEVAGKAHPWEIKKCLESILCDITKRGEESVLPIVKTQEERFVYGIVLEPETVDAQNDIYSKEEIRNVCHKFMEEFGGVGLMHRYIVSGKVKILENYVAPCDLTIDGTRIKAGTWLMAVRIIDDGLWKAVKEGKLTGFSIGGSARRVAA